jgi:type VI secretion system secreted protein VgrG
VGSTSNTPDVSYSQDNRLLSIDTPLGKDVLLLQELSGHEGISRLFSYELDLLAHDNDSITFEDIVGQKVNITIQLPDETFRYINGYVSRFTQGATDERYFTHYHAQVVPWLWFLTRQADCRIFQNMKPPDIITAVLDLFSVNDYRTSLQGDYPTLEYCVQYRETSFNFVSRLMEQYGIFYYFDHTTAGQHTMVLADQSSGLPDCPGSPFSYDVQVGGLDDPQVVSAWHVAQELRTGQYTVNDYNFTTPSTSLLANERTVVNLQPSQDLELFDYPGLYTTKDEGDAVAELRMQEEETSYKVIAGASNCRAFMSGYSFELQNHYRNDQNTTYVLTEVRHFASEGETYTSGAEGGETYSNQFSCIPQDVAYRPPRLTPKPFVQGPQTALVVGKSGEEIWVDKYGRVIVQFYWDRLGEKNENSSCWIRTSQPWAGSTWGAMWIPRIGQEVIVSFLEGDPDRPIITGRVYNAEQMPPYALPANQTQSGFKSRSSKGGSASNYNEIRFEDKKGSEHLLIHAEQLKMETVEADSIETVGHDRWLTVENDQKEAIKGNKYLHVTKDQQEKIEGTMHLHVLTDQKQKVDGDQNNHVVGNLNEKIEQSASLDIGMNLSEKVGMNQAMDVGMDIYLKAGMNLVLEAGMALTLKASGGFITIGPGGIFISGQPMVMINSGGAAIPGTPGSPTPPNDPTDPSDPGSSPDPYK